MKRLGIVGGREFRCLLEVMAERPHRAKGDTAEVDDRRRNCDGRRGWGGRIRDWRRDVGVGEGGTEWEDEARHELP